MHTSTITSFLEESNVKPTRFVLLDHMDWLSEHRKAELAAEWQQIVDCAQPGSRILWRSGGLRTDFLDDVVVSYDGKTVKVPDLLTMNESQAKELHALDRVGTYGSFFIGDLAA